MLACTETLTPHTLLSYLYRDAANYKAHGAVLLSGEATSDLHRRIRESLIDGEYFIPEKVGIPSLREELYHYSEDGPTDDDHLLHEFVELRAALATEVASLPVQGNLVDLVMRFETNARLGWWTGVADLIEQLDLPL